MATLAVCPGAHAATLSVGDTRSESDGRLLTYTAAPGEQNRLAVSEGDAAVTFSDPGAVIALEGGCELAGPSIAVCRKDQVGTPLRLKVDLGDGDDTGRADLPAGGAFDPETGYMNDVEMQGGPGADELVGSELARPVGSNDLLQGGAGADRLYGRDGIDSLDGGPGPDRLDGGAGFNFYQGRGHDSDPSDDADVFIGSGGTDRLDYTAQYSLDTESYEERYRAVTANVRVSGDGVANDGAPGEGDDIGAGIEAVYLGNGNDYGLTGGDLLSIHGGGGDDDLHTHVAPGQVQLQGGHGNDVLTGDAGVDALGGHEGNDRITGGPGRDTVTGDEGDDWIDTRDPAPEYGNPQGPNAGHDWVTCGPGNDEIHLDESEVRSMAPWDGCELVHAPPGSSTWPPPAVAPPPVIAPVAAAGEERVLLSVKCGNETAACSGTLVLRTASSKKTVARGTVAGKKGKTRNVSVPLTSTGRTLLRRASSVKTRATLKPKAKGAQTITTKVVVKRR